MISLSRDFLQFCTNPQRRMLDLFSVVMEKKNLCVKQSDFSIDHILNRAGENVRKKHEIQELPFIDQWQGCSSQYHPENSVELHSHTPHLNWLQYTRYHPPKLPSKRVEQGEQVPPKTEDFSAYLLLLQDLCDWAQWRELPEDYPVSPSL